MGSPSLLVALVARWDPDGNARRTIRARDAYALTDAPVAYVWHGALHAGGA
jgi:hypothetical protein